MESYPACKDHLSTYFQKPETLRNTIIFVVHESSKIILPQKFVTVFWKTDLKDTNT